MKGWAVTREEEIAEKIMTRQEAWQKRMVAAGRCRQCGKPRQNYAFYCDACALKHREKARSRAGCEPYSGGRGRKPRVTE